MSSSVIRWEFLNIINEGTSPETSPERPKRHREIEEQRKFIAWWEGTVRRSGPASKQLNQERGLILSDAERLTGMKQQRVSDLGKRIESPDKYRDDLLGAEYRAACLEAPHVRGTKGTGENEWFTPAEYIAMAREPRRLGEAKASEQAAQAMPSVWDYDPAAEVGL